MTERWKSLLGGASGVAFPDLSAFDSAASPFRHRWPKSVFVMNRNQVVMHSKRIEESTA